MEPAREAEVERVTVANEHAGDHEIVRRVFARASDALYRFIVVRVGGDHHAADDLLQQTCVEAGKHCGPPADEEGCEAWLRGIARNLIRRHWRVTRQNGKVIPLEDPVAASAVAEMLESAPLAAEALTRKESVAQLMLAVTSLPAADQGLIFAFYFSGRSQGAIARELGVSERSIEGRLFRVRSRLREALQRMGRSGEV